jgi:hypothetical protein
MARIISKGDDNINVKKKLEWSNFKIVFITIGPILSRLDTKHPSREGLKFVQMKRILPHQGDMIAK